MFSNKDYMTTVAEDEAKFLDREDALLMVGHDEHKVMDGVIQPGVI